MPASSVVGWGMWRYPSDAEWGEERVQGRGCLPWSSKRRQIRLGLLKLKAVRKQHRDAKLSVRLIKANLWSQMELQSFCPKYAQKRDAGCNGIGAALDALCNCSNRVTVSDRHEIYLSLGHFAGKSKKEKSGLFQMYVGNKNTLMFFSNLGCSAEHKRFFFFSSFCKAFTQLNYFHFTRSH